MITLLCILKAFTYKIQNVPLYTFDNIHTLFHAIHFVPTSLNLIQSYHMVQSVNQSFQQYGQYLLCRRLSLYSRLIKLFIPICSSNMSVLKIIIPFLSGPPLSSASFHLSFIYSTNFSGPISSKALLHLT